VPVPAFAAGTAWDLVESEGEDPGSRPPRVHRTPGDRRKRHLRGHPGNRFTEPNQRAAISSPALIGRTREHEPVGPAALGAGLAQGKARRLIGLQRRERAEQARLGRLPNGVGGSPDHPAGSARGVVDDELSVSYGVMRSTWPVGPLPLLAGAMLQFDR
jgi:hypothetical protein